MCGGGTDGVSEEIDGRPGRRRGVRSVGAVDPDDGVEVQGTALLELGNLAVRHPGGLFQLALGHAGASGDLAAEPVGEALPELSGVVVEEDGARVVVGGRVEGGAECGVVGRVAGATAADTGVGAVVDRAEGGGSEGGEDAG